MTDLEVVDAPGRKGVRIDHLVPQRCRIATACHSTRARVDAELEAQAVHLIRDALDAQGELGGVGHELVSGRVPSV